MGCGWNDQKLRVCLTDRRKRRLERSAKEGFKRDQQRRRWERSAEEWCKRDQQRRLERSAKEGFKRDPQLIGGGGNRKRKGSEKLGEAV